jgi:hypothetical protein
MYSSKMNENSTEDIMWKKSKEKYNFIMCCFGGFENESVTDRYCL